MGNNDKYLISTPTLSNLKQKLFSELSDDDQIKYRCSSLVDCGELYDISGNQKLKGISKNFLANEFAYGKHDLIRIHEDLIFELEKLRYFFNTPINIITGYIPHSKYNDQKDYRGVQKNHVDGLAARISIKNISAKRLALFAIVIGKNDTSISEGENDIIIAVNQRERELDQRVASHVGENKTKRASRPGRERAEAKLREYYNYFHGQQSVEIARVLDNQYKQLRKLILSPKRKVDQDLGHELFRKFEKEQIKLIEHLNQNRKNDDFILLVLLYSDYINLYLHHHRFINENNEEQALKRKNNSINKIKSLLCPSLPLNPFYPSVDYQKNKEYLRALTECNKNKSKIPFKLHQNKNDEYVIIYLKNLIRKSIANKKQVKSLLKKPILGFDVKKLKHTVIAPDAPKYDITGRYEMHSNEIGVLGHTLVINQAGLHFEGVFSTVLSPQIKYAQKIILDIHGDIDEEGQYSGFFKAYQRKGEQITITLLKNKKILFTRIDNGHHDQYIFEKYHDDPIFLSPVINGLGEIVKRHEKAPLLIKQVTHLKNNFHQKSSRHELEKLLKTYFIPKKDGKKSIEYYQSRTAEEIDDYFKNVINNKEYGVHNIDSTLAQFYISFFLSNTFWAPSPRHDKLSIYDYLNLMVQQESTKKYGLGGFVGNISKYLGLPNYKENKTLFKYKAVIKLKGAIVNKTLIGGGRLKGTLKISKIGDVGLWKKPAETTFQIVTYVASIGKGTITKMEGETTFATPVEWFPIDFEGFVESVITEGAASALERKSIIGGFFMIIRNNKGSINLTFDESVFWKKSKSIKKPKPSVGAILGINAMWILEQNASEKFQLHISRSYFSNYISKFYTGTNKIYFIFDKDILVPAAIQTLRVFCALELAELTNKPSPVNMLIVGYSDRVGTEKHNTDLSQRRADSVLVGIQNILKHKDVLTIEAKTIPAGEKVAKYIGRDVDGKENPSFRGAKIFLNGRLALSLGDAILKRE